MDNALRKIVQLLEVDNTNCSVALPLSQLIAWMQSSDIETLGVVHALLGQASVQKCITPTLEFPDYFNFCSRYLVRCMKENPRGEWASSRYEAGWEFCRWFVSLWNDNTVPKTFLAKLKSDLECLYYEGDSELRTALENAVLEHLFEDGGIRAFFGNWQHDVRLADAYRNAKLWVDKGGSSPLQDQR
jgi:hypothetical protein